MAVKITIPKREPIDRLLAPFRTFAHMEASAGILLLVATVAALICANSGLHDWYHHLFELELGIALDNKQFDQPLHIWINDGLMAMFFFFVGLEIKREVLAGELSNFRKAAFPAVAAVGGMVVPALLYVAFNFSTEGIKGWGVPMATDIAFALGVLALLGDRVPVSLKIFLTALAIVDDLGAVLVIALFYSSDISLDNLAIGVVFLSVLAAMNALGVRRPLPYAIFGIGGLWTAFFLSGIHPTIAGVLAAFTIPARSRIKSNEFYERGTEILKQFDRPGESGQAVMIGKNRMSALLELNIAYDSVSSPLQRLEKQLHGPVLLGIMPLFAFANAGVSLGDQFISAILSPVSIGTIVGLLLGKQIGITGFAWLAVKLGIADLPTGISWRQIYFVSWLGGIGFTMSLFIAGLAFVSPERMEQAKIAVLLASALSGVGGWALLRFFGNGKTPKGVE